LKKINDDINNKKNINVDIYGNENNDYDEKYKDVIIKYKEKLLFYLDSINKQIENLEANTTEIKNNKSNVYDINDSKQKYYSNKTRFLEKKNFVFCVIGNEIS
jgi:hypothetical protein